MPSNDEIDGFLARHPIPAERTVAIRHKVLFGHGPLPDAPAPPKIVGLYRAWRERASVTACLREAYWDLPDGLERDHAFRDYQDAATREGIYWESLWRAVRYNYSANYLVDGVRLRWVVEPHGVRREYLRVENLA